MSDPENNISQSSVTTDAALFKIRLNKTIKDRIKFQPRMTIDCVPNILLGFITQKPKFQKKRASSARRLLFVNGGWEYKVD